MTKKTSSKKATEKKVKIDPTIKLTILGIPVMTKRQCTTVSNWLREQADYIDTHVDEIGKRYIARLMK